MRTSTIPQCVAEIQAADPNTAIKTSTIRKLVNRGEIPHIEFGNRFFVDLDLVIDYFNRKIA